MAVELWNRLPIDDDESWPAFVEFRDQKPPRKVLRHASKYGTEQLRLWYEANNWKERCAAYDNYMDSVIVERRRELLAQKTEDITVEHMSLLSDMREFLMLEVEKWLKICKDSDAPYITKPGELTKLIESVIKWERLIRGEATERSETKLDLSEVPVENLMKARELLLNGRKN